MNKSAAYTLIWTGQLKAHSGQGNYLRVDDDGMLVATEISRQNPAASFSMYRKESGEVILKSNLTGHYAGLVDDDTNGYVIRINEDFDSNPLLFGLGLIHFEPTSSPTGTPVTLYIQDPRYYPNEYASWQYLGAFDKYRIGVKLALFGNDPNQVFIMSPYYEP